MISTLFAFIAGWMLTWPAIVILSVLIILFEHNSARGWATTIALITAVTCYFFFNIPLLTLGIGFVIYLLVGLVWSFWRYKRHVNEQVEKHKDDNRQVIDLVLKQIHPKSMGGTIAAWVILWPFSLIENLIGDFINGIQTLVQKVFRGVYHKIYNSAVSSLIK